MFAHPRRVLVVDDDRASREGLARLLRGDGFDVGVAADGLEAVETAKRVQPHLVVLDLQMPGLDGFEVIEHLRTDDPTLPIIVVASLVSAEERRAVAKVSPHAYFSKPVEYDLLFETIRALCPDSGDQLQ